MSDLKGVIGELTFTMQITRKDTGKIEEYKMVGVVDDEKLKSLQDAEILPKDDAPCP